MLFKRSKWDCFSSSMEEITSITCTVLEQKIQPLEKLFPFSNLASEASLQPWTVPLRLNFPIRAQPMRKNFIQYYKMLQDRILKMPKQQHYWYRRTMSFQRTKQLQTFVRQATMLLLFWIRPHQILGFSLTDGQMVTLSEGHI